MTPWFHPAAEQEIAAALKVGEERGFGLGRELVQEIRRVSSSSFRSNYLVFIQLMIDIG
jgi:hypothetical protein